MNKRDRVALLLQLLEKLEGSGPLYFCPSCLEEQLRHYRHITDPVELVLSISYHIDTYDSLEAAIEDSDPFCDSGSRRSSYDLWRMVRGLGHNMSLAEVMVSLNKNQSKYASNVCGGVGRRVFRIPGLWAVGQGHSLAGYADEYGLEFSDWGNILEGGGLAPAIHKMYDPNNLLWTAEYADMFTARITNVPETF